MLSIGLVRAWENPEITSFNKLPARATFDSYPGARQARANVREKSPWFQSLDGVWQFRYFTDPAKAQSVAERRVADEAGEWGTIPVPSNWQMHGHHFPHYTNVKMPFREEPPFTPETNPTGVYRRRFHIPASWNGGRVVLHFGSADSVLAVYVDGVPVGLSKDSRLPAEFDLSPLVRPDTEHELVAIVVQYSDASFIEDQDMWRLGGLPREVFLYFTPAVHLADIKTTPHVNLAAHTAELEVLVKVGFPRNLPLAGSKVAVRLLDPRGRAITTKPAEAEVVHERGVYVYDRGHIRVRIAVSKNRLRLWSHESPTRYTVVVSLTPPKSARAASSHTSIRVGFRTVEIRRRDLLINGRRVLIKGVNHHEHHPDHAKAVPIETLRRDVILMKRFNFNAVRLSHYPHHPRFLDFCDEYGLYAIDEANAESHDFHNTLCQDARYALAWQDRVQRMVARDINHPSIIAWSLGNESGYGPAHDATAAWIRHHDPSRPVHFESAISRWQSGSTFLHGSAATDLICPMYPGIEELTRWLDFADRHCPATPAAPYTDLLGIVNRDPGVGPLRDRPYAPPLPTPLHPLERPVLLCEYSHAMGNSNGSLSDYYHLFKNRAGIQGGFIWEWLDHGIRRRLPDGREHFAYGGDFGDTPNSANFVCDGLVSADRMPHAACHEHHRLAQPVSVALLSTKGSTANLRIRNEHDFLTLDAAGVRGHWTLQADGRAVRSGAISAKALKGLAPGAHRDVALELGELPAQARERHLTVEFCLARATAWAHASHLIAAAQLTLPLGKTLETKPRPHRGSPAVTVTETADGARLSVGEVVATFTREAGALTSLRCGEHELIAHGPRLQLWRAATDNDGIKLWAAQDTKALGRWQKLGLDRGLLHRPIRFEIATDANANAGSATVTLAHQVTTPVRNDWEDARHIHRYTLHADGRLSVANEITLAKAYTDLPRVGVRLDLVAGLNRLSYFGRGPFENYCDRKTAADLGVWENTVAGEYVDYVMPQEHGHHCDVRWLKLGPDRGQSPALCIRAEDTLEFNATHFPAEDLYSARHTTDLQARPETILYLDAAHRGLGSASCGPDTLERFRVTTRRHKLFFTLEAMASASAP